MKVKVLTETKEFNPVWTEFDVDIHNIQGYWNIPKEITAGVTIPSEEYNIISNGLILTIKECADLINFLKYKFEK